MLHWRNSTKLIKDPFILGNLPMRQALLKKSTTLIDYWQRRITGFSFEGFHAGILIGLIAN
jgi:hypothetical protein